MEIIIVVLLVINLITLWVIGDMVSDIYDDYFGFDEDDAE